MYILCTLTEQSENGDCFYKLAYRPRYTAVYAHARVCVYVCYALNGSHSSDARRVRL